MSCQPLRRANRRQPPRSVRFLSSIPAASCRSRERSAKRANANGVPSSSRGLRRQALPWVMRSRSSPTPTGLWPHRRHRGLAGTPMGFTVLSGCLSRVAAPLSRQPWAGGRNAVGVRRDCFRSCERGALNKRAPGQRRSSLLLGFEGHWLGVPELGSRPTIRSHA